jgi:hypothetical protein
MVKACDAEAKRAVAATQKEKEEDCIMLVLGAVSRNKSCVLKMSMYRRWTLKRPKSARGRCDIKKVNDS